MSKNLLSSQQAKTIDPDEVSLVFPDNKQVKWRRDSDVLFVGETPDDDPFYDKRVLLPVPNESVRDFKEIGVMLPVLLFQNNGRIYIADGIQRDKIARIGNAELIDEGKAPKGLPYLFISYQEALQLHRLRTSANYHRTDDTPQQKAEHAQRLLNQGMPEQEVATAMRTSVQSVRDYKRYMSAPAEVLAAGAKGELAFTTILDWQKAKVAPEEQIKSLTELKEATAGRTTLAGTPKRASGTEAKKVAAKKETKTETISDKASDHTKTIAKIYRLLEELTAEERLTIFAKYGDDGEEKPVVSAAEVEAQNQSIELDESESDVPELKIELDSEQTTEDAVPKKSKSKRAGKK